MIDSLIGVNAKNVVDAKNAARYCLAMEKKNRLDIMPSNDLLEAIDGWRAKQFGVPPRATAARTLIEVGLASVKYEEEAAAKVTRKAKKTAREQANGR